MDKNKQQLSEYLYSNSINTCGPFPVYIIVTILSSNVMSSFWLKSRSLAASSERLTEVIVIGGMKIFYEDTCKYKAKVKFYKILNRSGQITKMD